MSGTADRTLTGQRKRWYWYIARENELLLDLDSDAACWFAVLRLARNMRREFLNVQAAHLYRSAAPGHYHMIVTLAEPMLAVERAIWECQLGSDITRTMYIVMRILRSLEGADLLIANRIYPGFREPDHVCDCREKHKAKRITNHCPVLHKLHGTEAGAEYFAIEQDRKRRRVLRMPVGKIPLSKILKS